MDEFALMSNALNFTYKALEVNKMDDWQCCSCGQQQDGILGYVPNACKECGCCDFEPAAEAEKREAENRAINKHDEYLDEQESDRIIDSCKKKWLGYIARKETKDE